jgi:tRNA (cytidine/uridine-2'-O-)-methyltransferase
VVRGLATLSIFHQAIETRGVFEIILYQPEIPPNTGNIIRLCANTGARLHLVEPLGFELDDVRLRRAGLDYHELANVSRYPDWASFCRINPELRFWAFSTHGQSRYDEAGYQPSDGLLFGPETRGLPTEILTQAGNERVLRLPMCKHSRSLNLSNTVAIALYEALRQNQFTGLA